MIRHLSGTVIHTNEKSIIIDINGIGYLVYMSLPTQATLNPAVGHTLACFVYHSIREDTQELFGFASFAELELFELLLSISGIGPRSALGVLAVAPIETLAQAIRSGDLAYLTRISGIGKKTAEKILLELRDKIPHHLGGQDQGSTDIDALDALIALGYTEHKARSVLQSITETDTTAKIREALKLLQK